MGLVSCKFPVSFALYNHARVLASQFDCSSTYQKKQCSSANIHVSFLFFSTTIILLPGATHRDIILRGCSDLLNGFFGVACIGISISNLPMIRSRCEGRIAVTHGFSYCMESVLYCGFGLCDGLVVWCHFELGGLRGDEPALHSTIFTFSVINRSMNNFNIRCGCPPVTVRCL